MNMFDTSFRKAPRRYIVQSLLAFGVLAVILYFIDTLTHAAIIASLGASVFIVFTMPNTISAEPRRIIGGHITGLVTGILCFLFFFSSPLSDIFRGTGPLHWIPPAFSVGLSMFLMSILNFEHPPAAGTSLAIVTSAWSPRTVAFVVIFAVSLALIKLIFKNFLKDLTN